VTLQNGNAIYKFSADGGLRKHVLLNSQPLSFTPGGPDPHEIMLTPDGSRYFVTCQGTNEVKVVDAHSDAVLHTFAAGSKPQEIAMSRTQPYMFVTCQEDPRTEAQTKGSVYVYNYNTLELVTVLRGNFYQPHGLTVDDRNGRLYVVSTNAEENGPAPHHAGICGGRNGWYSIYDINTLQPVSGRRYETSVFPYSADSRFK
jgi:DNA-binding beta-propeller fold protein YncE